MKKFLSLLMAAAMVVTMVPATAFAANANTKLIGGTKSVDVDAVTVGSTVKANEIRVTVDSDSTLKVGDSATFTFTVDNAVFKTGVANGDVITASLADFMTAKVIDQAGNTVGNANITKVTVIDTDDDNQTIEVKVADLQEGNRIAFVPTVTLAKASKNTVVTLDVSVGNNISADFSCTLVKVAETDLKVTAAVVEQTEERANDGKEAGLGKIVIDDTIASTLIKNGEVIKLTLKGDYEWDDVNTVSPITNVGTVTFANDEDGDQKIAFITMNADAQTAGKLTIYKDNLFVVATEDVSAGDTVKVKVETAAAATTAAATANAVTVNVLKVVDNDGVVIALDDEDEDMVEAWAGMTDDGDAWEALKVKVDGLDTEEFNENRKMTISVPAGVVITSVEDSEGVFTVSKYDLEDNEITLVADGYVDGTTEDTVFTFEFVTAADFAGDVELTFGGSAIPEEKSVVVATVKTVLSIENSTVKVESGYKSTKIEGTVVIKEAEGDLFDKNDKLTVVTNNGSANTNTNNKVTYEFDADVNEASDADVSVKDNVITIKSASDEDNAMVITLSNIVAYIPTTTALGSYKLRVQSTGFDAAAYDLTAASNDEVKDALAAKYSHATGTTVAAFVGDDGADIDFNMYVQSAKNFFEVVAAGTNNSANNNAFTKVVDVTIGEAAVTVDGVKTAVDAAAYINADNRTMVPLRAVAVALGVSDDQIVWVAASKTVIVNYADTWISMQIGNQIMKVNGIEMAMTTAPEVVNGRTYLPMADLGRALGVTASWDAATKTASFNK